MTSELIDEPDNELVVVPSNLPLVAIRVGAEWFTGKIVGGEMFDRALTDIEILKESMGDTK